MIRDLMRDGARSFPTDDAAEVTALRVWHCKYHSLAEISAYENVNTLIVATYPDVDLAPLGSLRRLRYLSILHLPKVHDLAPIAQLSQLDTLRLATLPSWDSSGKSTVVDSLAPIASCPNLRHLELFGVGPADKSLRDLERASALLSVRVSKYPRTEVARYRAATGVSDRWAPGPAIEDWH